MTIQSDPNNNNKTTTSTITIKLQKHKTEVATTKSGKVNNKMAPRGYEYEVVGDHAQNLNLKCPVCKHLIRDCVELPCAHTMCKQCIDFISSEQLSSITELSKDDDEADTVCPLCETVYIMEWVKESKAMDRIIMTSVKIKCPQNQLGCDWRGEISTVDKHEEKCKYKAVGCENHGCSSEVMRCNLQKHLNICEYQIVPCDHCSMEVPQIEMENHYTKCNMCPQKCSNEQCEEEMIREELAAHLENDCLYEPIPCKYHVFGCPEKVKRSTMKIHLDEGISNHMELLFNSNKDLEKSHEETKKELDDAQRRLVKTTLVLKEFNEMLNQTRRELEATKQELAQFKKETTEKIDDQQKVIEEQKLKLATQVSVPLAESPRDSPTPKSPRQRSPEPEGVDAVDARESPEPKEEGKNRKSPTPKEDNKKGILKKAKSVDSLITTPTSPPPHPPKKNGQLKLPLKQSDSSNSRPRSNSSASSISTSSSGSGTVSSGGSSSSSPPPSKGPLSPLSPKRGSPPLEDLKSPTQGDITTLRRRQAAAAIKPIITRPSTPLQAIIEAMNNSPINDYPAHYHAMLQNMEPDRFYVVNGDLLIKVNTFGSLRPYAVIYIQPWEERRRNVFQDMKQNKRTKHHSERVCIEANSHVGIVKILVNCTLNDTLVSVVCTTQNTAFAPASVETMGWGFNVPAGLHRNAFFHQEHMLIRLRQRMPDVDRLTAGM